MLARKFLPDGVWLMRNLRFSPPQAGKALLDLLHRDRLLFEPEKENGILPINLNPNDQGEIIKGQFLFLGRSHEEVFDLLKQVSEDKDFKGIFDRD